MPKPKTIVFLVAMAAVVVTVAVGLSWKQIYYAVYPDPEARFWGRWRIDSAELRREKVKFVIEFCKSGEVHLSLGGESEGFSPPIYWSTSHSDVFFSV